MIPAVIWAAGTISVTPYTNLSNGQVVTVSGSGFTASSTGSILECNSDPNQPTISFFGSPISVSCSNPFSHLATTDSTGNLPSTSFTIVTGTVGPPTTGTDSSGSDAATDAAAYPCPPTYAQVQAGDVCNLSFGDEANDTAVQNLTFTTSYSGPAPSQPTKTPGTSSSTTTNKSTSTSTKTAPSTATSPSTPATATTPQSSTKSQVSSKATTTATATLTVAVNTTHAKPIPGAKVTLDNKTSQTTDKNGLVTFQSVAIGKHTIVVNDPGKKPNVMQATLTSGQDKLLSVEFASSKSDTMYYILAGVIVILLGCGGYVYRKRLHRSFEASGDITPGIVVNDVSTNTSTPAPVNLPAQQVVQVVSPNQKRL